MFFLRVGPAGRLQAPVGLKPCPKTKFKTVICQLLLFPLGGEVKFGINHVLLLLLLLLPRVGISDAASCRPTLSATRRFSLSIRGVQV